MTSITEAWSVGGYIPITTWKDAARLAAAATIMIAVLLIFAHFVAPV